MLDLKITGGRVVSPLQTVALDVGVRDGRVVLLAAPGSIEADAARTIDASGCYVVPGGVDAHVHFSIDISGSGTMEAQSSLPGSRAAAFGGTTTFIDFAWQNADRSLVSAIEERKAVFERERPHVDYALHAMLTGEFPFEVTEEIPDAIAGGVSSFKMFTTFAGGPSGSMFTDDGRIWSVMQQTARHGGTAMVHCEDDHLIDFHVRKLYREGCQHASNIHLARPALVEEAAMSRMLLLARRSGSPLYVVHVSSIEGAELIWEARGRGEPATGEVLHNALGFTDEAYSRPHCQCYHNYPSLKSEADQERLWLGLAGGLSTVASDDYTVPLAQKLAGETVDNVTGGNNGVETRMAILFSEGVQKGRLSIERFVELSATAPARQFGLFPRKGVIAPGSDADIVVIDPSVRKTIALDDLHSECEYSIWEGWACDGYPTVTIARGQVLVEDGAWVGPEHAGEFVPAGATQPA